MIPGAIGAHEQPPGESFFNFMKAVTRRNLCYLHRHNMGELVQAQGELSMVFHSMGFEDVERVMVYPNTAIASDGWIIPFGKGVPHPRSYGTNARVLAEFVRHRHVLRLEDAVRRMTSLPARTFGFRDRGMVRQGFWADLVLFDPDHIEDASTFEKPHQYSKGFDLVLVNGTPVVENGQPTGARSGQVLRHVAQ